MKHVERWRPSKYDYRDGRMRPSRDIRELAVSSRLMAQLLIDQYQTALAAHARGRLLDLGCGKVPFYGAYAPFVDESVCVDWPGSVHGGEHVDVFSDLSSPLPFADASFDTVLSSDVVEHLPDPVLAFREMGRILKPGGMLILNTPFLYMLHETPHDYYRHTRFSLERLARAADLEVVRLEEIGGLADVLVDLTGKGLSVVPVLGSGLSLIVQGLAIMVNRTSLWKHLRKQSRERFPLGYFLVARRLALQPPVLPDVSA